MLYGEKEASTFMHSNTQITRIQTHISFPPGLNKAMLSVLEGKTEGEIILLFLKLLQSGAGNNVTFSQLYRFYYEQYELLYLFFKLLIANI